MIQPHLTYDDNEHVYKWRGSPKPSVTEILSCVGVRRKNSSKDIPNDWRPVGFDDRFLRDDTAAQFGIAFHRIASIILNGGVPNFPTAMEPWVRQLYRYLKDYPCTPLVNSRSGESIIECPMYHEIYGYAGTPDAVVITPKMDIVLLDWKTSTTEQTHWYYQTAAYVELVRHVLGSQLGKKTIIRRTVRFTETCYYPMTRVNRPEDWTGFQSCLNVYRMAA